MRGGHDATIATHATIELSGPSGRAAPVKFYPGHVDPSRIVDLTQASFLLKALCGGPVKLDGEPDIPVICEDCDRLGREGGGDPKAWVTSVLTEHETLTPGLGA